MKKIPMRMCVVTREKLPKKDLIRIVNTEDGIKFDKTGKVNGHGVYIQNKREVILKARDKKIIDHTLGVEVPDELFETLLSEIN